MKDLLEDTARRAIRYLSELDAVVGDGDHGFSMATGFAKTVVKLDSLEDTDIVISRKRKRR